MKNTKRFLEGFGFGLILQMAIGPVCLYILSASINRGIFDALLAVIAVAIVDSLYILLAIFGIVAWMKKERFQLVCKIFGSVVLMLFGLDCIVGSLGHRVLPEMTSVHMVSSKNPFINGLILTVSNPLTILFWSGVFSDRVNGNDYRKIDLAFFSVGSIVSTLAFLSVVAMIGRVFHDLLPKTLVTILNGTVGIVLIAFSIKLMFKRSLPPVRTS